MNIGPNSSLALIYSLYRNLPYTAMSADSDSIDFKIGLIHDFYSGDYRDLDMTSVVRCLGHPLTTTISQTFEYYWNCSQHCQ